MITWQAGAALADWACENSDKFTGKSIIELGSGTGLTGFVIGKICQPTKLILTDGNSIVMKLLTENFRYNFNAIDNVGNCLIMKLCDQIVELIFFCF